MHWFDSLSTAMSVKKSRRDALKVFAAGAGGVALAKAHVSPMPAFAAPVQVASVSYPPGWNLVSGPDGSRLVGNTSSVYTLQPGDRAYQALPPDTSLKGGWGYWAYFPQGGSLQAGSGSSTYTTRLIPDQYAMIGNPSVSAAAIVSGQDTLLTYAPGGDYQNAGVAIAPGQGAWALGTGTITVVAPESLTSPTSGAAIAPPAPPIPLRPCIDGQYGVGEAGVTCRITGATSPTAYCRDGNIDYSRSATLACSSHGGVLYFFANAPASGAATDASGASVAGAQPSSSPGSTQPTGSGVPTSTAPTSSQPTGTTAQPVPTGGGPNCTIGCACGNACITCSDICHK